MKHPAFLAAIGLSTCVLATGLNTETKAELTLVAMEQAWIDATARGDRAALDQILDDSFIETMPNGARRSKADILFAPTLPPGTVQTVGDLKIRVFGNVATVSGVSRYTPAFGINATSYAFTDLYVRRGNTWRVASSRTVREATT